LIEENISHGSVAECREGVVLPLYLLAILSPVHLFPLCLWLVACGLWVTSASEQGKVHGRAKKAFMANHIARGRGCRPGVNPNMHDNDVTIILYYIILYNMGFYIYFSFVLGGKDVNWNRCGV
jgi:hypothetical protein